MELFSVDGKTRTLGIFISQAKIFSMPPRFRGTVIKIDGPERLLPTESTGIDLREARSMNRPAGGKS